MELSLYVNRNCQIGVHGPVPGGGGTCPIAGDAKDERMYHLVVVRNVLLFISIELVVFE